MKITKSHVAVIGAQLVVFAGYLPAVDTWRQLTTLVLAQTGVTLLALTQDPVQGRTEWSSRERAAAKAVTTATTEQAEEKAKRQADA